MTAKYLRMKMVPSSVDLGLLFLRVGLCASLFLKHGVEKILHFGSMAQHFPDPFHLGPGTGLAFALLGDSICSMLIILGLAARWAALVSFANIFIAWALVHHFLFFGHEGDHGEVIVLYLAGLLAIFVAGPGKFSLDERFGG